MAQTAQKYFPNRYCQLIKDPFYIKEPEVQEGAGKRITEEVVRCLWFGGHFEKTVLSTEEGLRIEVISPGWWNAEEGPDHLNAELLMEGRGHVKGDVEIHVYASDWSRHSHDKQEGYRGVCLHVVMWNDTEQSCVKDSSGRKIPQLVLSKYISIPPEELPLIVEGLIDLPHLPQRGGSLPVPCSGVLAGLEAGKKRLGYILDQAGDERILSKARRLEERLREKSYEQVLYEGLMEAMGYKKNVLPFAQLACLMSVEELRSLVPVDAPLETRALWIQTLLLGAAGILSQWQEEGRPRAGPGKDYINAVLRLWQKGCSRWGKGPMGSRAWHWAGSRPLNSPPRRIAAMAQLLAGSLEEGFFRKLLGTFERARGAPQGARKIVKEIENWFLELQDPFWSYHLSPDSQRLSKPIRLIGRERLASIFINTILPLFLVYARRGSAPGLEEHLYEVYKTYPKLPTDSVVRFMTQRILAPDAKTLDSARRQQGLHQVFRDFCSRKGGCRHCGLLLAMEA